MIPLQKEHTEFSAIACHANDAHQILSSAKLAEISLRKKHTELLEKSSVSGDQKKKHSGINKNQQGEEGAG